MDNIVWLNEGASVSGTGVLFSAPSVDNLFAGNFSVYKIHPTLLSSTRKDFLGGVNLFIPMNTRDIKTVHDDDGEANLAFKKYHVGDLKLGFGRSVYVVEDLGIDFHCGFTAHTLCGTWSSYPPHEFEMEGLIKPIAHHDFHEKFAYITNPAGGWGIQVKNKEMNFFHDRMIDTIPLGSHPVVGGPGYKIGYIWAYTGGQSKFDEYGRI